ncbi:MAG: YciI family protein [Verrucomicrobium sp.]
MSPDATSNQHMLIFRDNTMNYLVMSAEQREQLLEQWNAWYDGIAKNGKMVTGRPLERGGRMVSSSGGRTVDGPFAESIEAVGGFFLLDVDDIEEATAIAKNCPSLKYGLTVEVRPVAGICPKLTEGQTAGASAEAALA